MRLEVAEHPGHAPTSGRVVATGVVEHAQHVVGADRPDDRAVLVDRTPTPEGEDSAASSALRSEPEPTS